jgi:phosphoglycerol transferase MdoB-like AlkP superfamily enzyme
MLPNDFRQKGYTTAFYYGGDISFVNTRGYVLGAGFQRYTDKSNYPQNIQFSWGAHDEAVFEKMLKDLDTVKTPFFYSMLTLSNHEPHVVPMTTGFEEGTFQNSAYYADKCMGDFIDSAKTKPWWKNTLLIFVADHGIRHTSERPHYDESIQRIPMLWIGGALKVRNMEVNKLGSQRDIAATLLLQLGMPVEAYKFSSNLLNPCKPNFAFYTYNNGLCFVQDSAVVVYDNNQQKLLQEDNADSVSIKQAKALFQAFNDDYLAL